MRKSSTPSTKTLPSVIPLNYDYQTMSPSSSSAIRSNLNSDRPHCYHHDHHHHQHQHHQHHQNLNSSENVGRNEDDNQYISFFGDPVPPPPHDDFLGEHFGSSQLYGMSTSTDDHPFSRADSFDDDRRPMRLFSQTPYTTINQRFDANVNDRLKLLSAAKPPDIQILPDSDGSSTERRNLLNFSQTQHRSSLFELNSPMAAPEATRRVSDISEDFKSHVGSLSQSRPEIPDPPSAYYRQISNESYSSSEWFKPLSHDIPEFTKMPKMRPSSKNVLSIKRHEMPVNQSPVAAMINDSNGSSSGEDHRLIADFTASRLAPIRPSGAHLTDVEENFYHEQDSVKSLLPNYPPVPPPLPPPPPPPLPSSSPPPLVPPAPAVNDANTTMPKGREISPVIFKESITTGADYRIEQTRSHKKTSFTIIAEKSPQSSRAQSPTPQPGPVSPFLGHGFRSTPLLPTRPIAKPRRHLQQKSKTSINLRLPTIDGSLTEESPRPSVQFNMTDGGQRIVDKTSKGILQRGLPNTLPPLLPLAYGEKMKSCEALPLITDPYRTAIPRLHKSQQDLQKDVPRTAKSNQNPTRKQRGLLRVISSADSSSRIPVRSNWASADDLPSLIAARRRPSLSPPLRLKDRRSSSTSPERRSSTQTEPRSSFASDRRSSNLSSVTTSDFSFRRNSFSSAATSRRKSIFQSADFADHQQSSRRNSQSINPSNIRRSSRTPRKVAKPTTLSPIIGTPNKESASPRRSPVHGGRNAKSSKAKGNISRRNSMSKIPVRNSPNELGTKMYSHGNSRVSSRSSSPLKDFGIQLELFGLNSKSDSRSPSRTTRRSDSRPTSRAADSRGPSRSTSRASTRQISRSNSRPNSRMEQAKALANSRSNSRLSQRGGAGDLTNLSARNSPPRRKAVSRSSSPRKTPAPRRNSLSPGKKSLSPSVGRNRTSTEQQRRNSRSRIPARISMKRSTPATKSNSKSRSPPKAATAKKRVESTTGVYGLRKVSPSRGSQKRKETPSAKKVPGSVRKPESSVRRTPSSVRKESATTTKKQSNVTQKTGFDVKRDTGSVRKTATARNKGQSEKVIKTETKHSASSLKDDQSKTQPKSAEDAKKTEVAADRSSTAGQEKMRGRLERQSSSLSLIRIGSRLNILSKKTSDGSSGRNATSNSDAAQDSASESNGKLVPLTKANVVSMTTAAITAQPVQITTALTNQLPKNIDDMTTLPAAIIEKSQKTLENIQKTVTEATDEIHKTINENLTDLKSFENDMGKLSGDGDGNEARGKIVQSIAIDDENQKTILAGNSSSDHHPAAHNATQPIEAAVSVVSNGSHDGSSDNGQVNPARDVGERVSERAISVLPDVVCESANFQNNDLGRIDETNEGGTPTATTTTTTATAITTAVSGEGVGVGSSSSYTNHKNSFGPKPDETDGISETPDGYRTGSQELLKENDDDSDELTGWRKCCSKLCIPCRRSRCLKCCQRSAELPNNPIDAGEKPVLSATSSTTTTNLDVINETQSKTNCWKKLNCCCRRKNKDQNIDEDTQHKMGTIHEEETSLSTSHGSHGPSKQNKCGACIRKVFCCRSTNKVEATINPHDEDDEAVKKCCFCIRCKKKIQPSVASAAPAAWEDPERAVGVEFAEDLPQEGKCARFCGKLLCCRRKKPPPAADSRRASMKTTMAPPEDTRRKLHVDLVEYNSKMKGAIPVMPLYLAWFCAICNTLFPGLGTLLSGFFCLCVGIPRFSSYDSAKARVGSLVINCIVAISQLFCVLFCFVGWGWSIWWGTIMLKTAKKLAKIRKVEKLEMEEEQRQAEAAAAAAVPIATQPIQPTATATVESDTETKAS